MMPDTNDAVKQYKAFYDDMNSRGFKRKVEKMNQF